MKWLLVALVFVVEIVSQAAPIKPRAGETVWEGTIGTAVGRDGFVLKAKAVTLPDGKTKQLSLPTSKTVLIDGETLVTVRGDEKSSLTLGDLKRGVHALVVGVDNGAGLSLKVRLIVVWEGEKNGVYLWSGSRFSLNADEVPPEEAASKTLNAFVDGNFQSDAVGAPPRAWHAVPGTQVEVREAKHRRWLQITSPTVGEDRYTTAFVPLKSEWKTVRISALLSVKNLQPGTESFSVARLAFGFHNNPQGHVFNYAGLNLHQDFKWTRFSHTMSVGQHTGFLLITAGFSNSAGELCLADVRVEPNVSVEAVPIRAGFPEGTFERTGVLGVPDGFSLYAAEGFRVSKENGNHFLRLTKTHPISTTTIAGQFAVPPNWNTIKLRARLRAKNLHGGARSEWMQTEGMKAPTPTVQVALFALTEQGRYLDRLKPLQLQKDSDWTTVEVINTLPPGTAVLRVQPLMHAHGVFDVDDIYIERLNAG